jgi:hypothetical protein
MIFFVVVVIIVFVFFKIVGHVLGAPARKINGSAQWLNAETARLRKLS